MSKTVLAFGEVLWDILPSETVLGGAVCNFAYRLNSLGDKGLVISRLGRDELGKKAYDRVSSLGMDTDYLQWDDHYPTGTVNVTFDKNNKPDFVIISNVAYDYIEMTESLYEISSKADCLCFGTLSQRAPKTRETLKQLISLSKNSLKLLDINLRKDCYSLDTISYSLEHADVLKLNEDELYQLAKMKEIPGQNAIKICENTIKRWFLKCCVVTLGEKGAFVVSETGERFYDPGYRIKLADSVGAGDAFTAGFAYCILRNMLISEACKFGNILGALVSTKNGATSPVTKDEIESFKNSEIERIYNNDIGC